MATHKFLSLAAAAIFVLDTTGAHAMASTNPTNSAARVNCSAAMNAARNLVGFTALTVEEKLPLASNSPSRVGSSSTYEDSVCKTLKANDQGGGAAVKLTKIDGTYAYAVQDGANANCEAAVEQWKEALSNFTSLPPKYTEDTEPYTNAQNISFISLFNPKENPKVDCAYFTCPAQEAAEDPSPSEEEEEEEERDPSAGALPDNQDKGNATRNMGTRSATSTEKEVKALVCVTTPNALTVGNAPYTQTQWDQITTGLNKNAATGVPTFLGFAAAAVAALFL